jgi:hypothetical protein
MPRRLLLTVLVAAAVCPSTAVAAVCGSANGSWQTAASASSADRTLPASARLRISVRARRTAGAQRIVALRTNRMVVTRGARRVALRTASGRTLVTARVAGSGWRTVEVTLDAVRGRVGLKVGAGRGASARARVAPERAVRLGGAGGRVQAAKVSFQADCGAIAGSATAPAAPAPAAAGAAAPAAQTAAPVGVAAPAEPVVPPAQPAADPGSGTAGACGGCPFAPTSFWNAPLAADAPLAAQSATWVAELRRQLSTTNPWINTTTYSTPVYTVPAGQPTVRVNLDTTEAGLQQAFEQVPIPAGAQPAAGSDAHMVVWQPATDTMWEFWLASLKADGWHARWGGRMTGVSTNPGYFTAPNPGWGATATSLPLLGGLMRISELESGRIDHALAFAIPHTKLWTSWSWPAQRSDGDTDSPDAIPEGARFRLPADLDIDALNLPPVTAAIAKAVQRYGMVLRDKSGSVSFYAEDPTPTGANPYPGLFKTWTNLLFAKFPWDRLQALRTDMRGPVTGS